MSNDKMTQCEFAIAACRQLTAQVGWLWRSAAAAWRYTEANSRNEFVITTPW